MIFETKRLLLRPWMIEDAEKLYNIAKDPLVGPSTGWAVHENAEQSREVIENILSKPGNYAVVLKDTDEIIGDVGVKYKGASEVVRNDKEIEFGCWLSSKHWGNGYIPEAIESLQSFLITVKGIRGFWYGFYEGNEKSRRVAEKLGFTYSHVLRGHYVKNLDMKTDAYYWYAKAEAIRNRLIEKTENRSRELFAEKSNKSDKTAMVLEYGAERNWQPDAEIIVTKRSEEKCVYYKATRGEDTVGSLCAFCDFNCLMIKDIFVKDKKTATTLLKAVASTFKGIVFLYIDKDDPMKNTYKSLCFDEIFGRHSFFRRLLP